MYFFSMAGKFKPSTVLVWCSTNCLLICLRHSHNKSAGVPTTYRWHIWTHPQQVGWSTYKVSVTYLQLRDIIWMSICRMCQCHRPRNKIVSLWKLQKIPASMEKINLHALETGEWHSNCYKCYIHTYITICRARCVDSSIVLSTCRIRGAGGSR